MEMIVAGTSAFRLYRTPPQALITMPRLPVSEDRGTRMSLHAHPLVKHVFGYPIDTLVPEHSHRTGADLYNPISWTGELPKESLIEVDGAGKLTSPEFTLFTMARSVPMLELALAMYEFCGEFSVYAPSEEVEAALAYAPRGWRRVNDSRGRGTNLWMRPPLTTVERIRSFADSVGGRRGIRAFNTAAGLVCGVVRPPMEAQAALLLSAPRPMGGYGLEVQTNRIIRLTPEARKLAQRDYCIADLYLESPDGTKVIDIECQGAAVHAGELASESDADRTTALEAMGLDVLLLSYGQMASQQRFALSVDLAAQKLSVELKRKTERMLNAECDLRRRIMIDWDTIGRHNKKFAK